MSGVPPDPALAEAARSLEGRRPARAEEQRGAGRPAPGSAPVGPRWRLPLILFLATVATTTLAQGPAYSATLMAILVAHEMGHYLVARRVGVPASLPHFIPLPPLPGFGLGTLGAVIQMDGQRADRRQLLEVGAAGPIAGFVVAVPAMVLGLSLSEPATLEPSENVLYFGNSILSWALEAAWGPDLGPGEDLVAHPVYVAAWAGFLVTALNLLPMGQLDGGHVLHAAMPSRSARIARRLQRVLIGLGLAGLAVVLAPVLSSDLGAALAPLRAWLSPGLLVWAALAGWLGVEHPPAAESGRRLTPAHWALVGLAAVILGLCFMPSPVYTPYAPAAAG